MTDFIFGFILGALVAVVGSMGILAACEDYYKWRRLWKRMEPLPMVNTRALASRIRKTKTQKKSTARRRK